MWRVILFALIFCGTVQGKPLCVIYGNCQMGATRNFFLKEFGDLYTYAYIWNQLVIEKVHPFPIPLFQNADLFIYQPLKGHGIYDTDYIKNTFLKKECVCIGCPFMYFLGYQPDYVSQQPNPFPYGFKELNNYICTEQYTVDEVIELSKRDDFLSLDYIIDRMNYGMNFLKNVEKSTTIIISDFIEENYKKHKLFYTVSHPTNFLLAEFLKRLLKALNLNDDCVENSQFMQVEVFGDHIVPIYPCVEKCLELEFENDDIFCYGRQMSYDTFIHEYYRVKYPEIYSAH